MLFQIFYVALYRNIQSIGYLIMCNYNGVYSKLMNLLGSILLAIFEGIKEARRVVRKSPMVMRERYNRGILNSISHPKEILFTT